jgi:hypothetical protein
MPDAMSPPWGTVKISVELTHLNAPGLWKSSVLCRFYAVFNEVPPQKHRKTLLFRILQRRIQQNRLFLSHWYVITRTLQESKIDRRILQISEQRRSMTTLAPDFHFLIRVSDGESFCLSVTSSTKIFVHN